MKRRPVPFTVLGGFLGAGKTTLLNHWLRGSEGRRIAVVVNDFGAINVDAMLIKSRTADVLSLTNGCVCCQIGGDLAVTLSRLLDAAEPFDAIVVEASGVSDPAKVAVYGRADPGLAPEGIIGLVDAAGIGQQAADPLLADSLQRQVSKANLIVLNKLDLATERERIEAHEWLDRWATNIPRLETTHAAVPLPLLSGVFLEVGCGFQQQAPASKPLEARPMKHSPKAGALFETWSAQPVHLLRADELRALLRRLPAGVQRLKGLVMTDEFGWTELQFAAGRGSLRPAEPPYPERQAAVAVGLQGQLPRDLFDAAFAAPPSRRAC